MDLAYHAARVQVVVAGRETITVSDSDTTQEIPVTEDGTMDLLRGDAARERTLHQAVSPGVELFSFTFG